MMANVHLLMLVALPSLLGYGVGGAEGEVVALMGEAAMLEPEFMPRQNTSVRGVLDRSVTLECRVLHQGDRTVSWVRVRDLQILTHSGVVFTADARVSVPPAPAPAPAPLRTRTRLAPTSHKLRIDRLRESDAGHYECQLNTEPKMSLFYELTVIDEEELEQIPEPAPAPQPWGEGEVLVWAEADTVRVGTGAAAELACKARMLAEPVGAAPPLDIRWMWDGKPLTLKDGCAVSRLAGASYAESRLRLVHVRARDAGEYACAAGASAATVRLEVEEEDSDEDMEAMQRDQSLGGADAAFCTPSTTLASLALLLTLHLAF